MRENAVLEIVYLDHCSIEDDGMNGLAASIMSLCTMDPPSRLRVLRFHGNLATEDGLKGMGLAFQMAEIKIDKMMPIQARRHFNKMSQIDTKQRMKQQKTVKRDLDDPEARQKLVHHQREICRLAAQLMFLYDEEGDDNESKREDDEKTFSLQNKSSNSKIKAKMNLASTRDALKRHRKKIKEIVNEEIDRIARLTKDRTEYYQIAGIRWKMLEDIAMDNKATEPHIQPHGFGATQDTVHTASLLLDIADVAGDNVEDGSAKTEDDTTSRNKFDSALLYAQICARNMNLYYQVALETVINLLNEAKTIHDIHLESSPCSVVLDFDDTDKIQGKRALLKFGPVKRCERAGVKSMEKQMEIEQGLLPRRSKKKGGRVLCGVDYVLDWLRATVVCKDPYVLYVTFMMLEECKVLRIHRIKNKFFDPEFAPNIRTNALINLMLLYVFKILFLHIEKRGSCMF